MRISAGLVRTLGIVALFLAAALAGTASGVVFAFMGDLPLISSLDDYTPPTTTRVLAKDGSVLGEFAIERRQVVNYEDIPVNLRNAIVSVEDATFFHHSGLNLKRIAVTAVQRVLRLRRYGGASTLTQQLTRKLFLTDEQTPERKIKEAILAIQIEKRYTKPEIFTMYCNRIYWGHGAYGVEAASQLYFAKPVKELNLDESAMLAGIIQGNVRQSPYVNMKAAVGRRNYTLDRMAIEGYITKDDAEAAKKRPIVVRGQPKQAPSIAPYFMETIRQSLEDKYGTKALLEGGLTVRTGIDPDLQRAANVTLDARLREFDKRRGYRKPSQNVLRDGHDAETYMLGSWTRDPSPGDVMTAIVLGTESKALQVRVGAWRGTVDAKGFAWTNRKLEDVAKRGDVIEVRPSKLDAKARTFTADLEQAPELQGAVLAIDNHTGEVRAMIGGQNFSRSQFNRAIQAQRQVGSLFKPIVFTAAIDSGLTATEELLDEPIQYDVGPNQPLYEPKNFDKKFEGQVTLRWALEDSRNVPTIGLMNALGADRVIRVARQLGVTSPIQPYLSSAIGSSEGNLLEMTSAYTAFPNQGVRMTPLMVLGVSDRDGNVLEQTHPEPHEALKADTAYVMTNLLEGVIEHGTGRSALSLNWPVGGKTGTTDDLTDAWFIGFDPDLTIGVWVGFDQKKTIGADAQGATIALPIWIDVMRDWVTRRRAELPDRPDFEKPGNIVFVTLDNGAQEVFIAGTEKRRN